jgi:Family of unknown function (DUF5719)
VTGVRVNRVVAPLAVFVAVAAVYGLTTLSHAATFGDGRPPVPPAAAAATSVVSGCASLGGQAAGHVALIAAPATAGAGQARLIRLAGGKPLPSVSQPGQLAVSAVKASSAPQHKLTATGQQIQTVAVPGGVVVQASGSMARGLEVEQIAATGVPAGRCASPGTDFWFVGPGQHSAARIDLYLLNAGSQSADVNVAVSTDAGPLQGSTDTGITVAPHSMVVQSLATALRGSRVVALHVRTSVGQVVAAVEEATRTSASGGWLPVAQSPAHRVVLPGLPATAGTRQVFVAVPGTQDAHLELTAVTVKGSYQPTGGTGIDVPGGSAVSIDLPSMSGVPAALKLTSNVPITASAMLTGGRSGAPGAFTAAALPLQEQGVVAYNRTGGGTDSQLVLSAPGRAARARLTEIGGTGTTQTVQIAAGHSLIAVLGKGGGSGHASAFAVVITPLAGSGPLYAGRVIIGSGTGGRIQDMLPVASALTKVPLPWVRNVPITTVP